MNVMSTVIAKIDKIPITMQRNKTSAKHNPTASFPVRVLQEPSKSNSHLDVKMGVLEALNGKLQPFYQNNKTTT